MKRGVATIWKLAKLLTTDHRLRASLLRNTWRLNRLQRDKNILFFAMTEHLGDLIAVEPAVGYLKTLHPGKTIAWVVRDRYVDIIAAHPGIHLHLAVTCFTEWILLRSLFPNLPLIDMHLDGKECDRHGWMQSNPNAEGISIKNYYQKGNLLYAFTRTAGLQTDATAQPKVHFAGAKNKGGKYILLHSSANSQERMWNADGWNNLASYLAKKLPDHLLIEIGHAQQVAVTPGNYRAACGHQSYSEMAALVRDAAGFIGVDSGPAHIANAFEKKSLLLFGHFQGFRDYLPYSGYFQKNRDHVIHYHQGPLSGLPFGDLLPKLDKIINEL
jgi:heptosyltransferase III